MAEELTLSGIADADDSAAAAASPGMLSAANLLIGAAQQAPQAVAQPAGLAPPARQTGGMQLGRAGGLKRGPVRSIQLGEEAP